MKRIVYFCFFLLLSLASCLPKQKVLYGGGAHGGMRNEPVKRVSKPVASMSSSSADYIARYKDIAISEMNQFGIPASIKLAQALLESGNGNSSLARQANNHFGIKCTNEWRGKRVLKDDDYVDDCFRVYSHPEESYRDHSEFLLRKRYAALFELDKNDYRGWARGLKSAGYATNPRYAELLINLIERYELFRYDSPELRQDKILREERVVGEIANNISDESKETIGKAAVSMTVHEVKRGETLYAIANKYGLTVEGLVQLNNIKGEKITLGQLLLVSN